MAKSKRTTPYIFLAAFVILLLLLFFLRFRIDLTSDKRYSISPQTKQLMKNVDEPMYITVYLDGDLNSGFLRLKRATTELLDELSLYSNRNLNIRYVNPSLAETNTERQEKYAELESRGMKPTAVYERDKEGKAIQKIIFPWLEVEYGNKNTRVNLLKNISGNNGEENLNISIENLEFEITDAIRRLTMKDVKKIAFIEGHGELTEDETYDISVALSRYFQIDRGVLGEDPTVLNDYEMIIIAKPTERFSEADKYIIDQYIMNGGRVLWLIDGVRLSKEELASTGLSPAIALDLNLNDMLFVYGARINPVVLQDVQSAKIPVNVAPVGEKPHFEPMNWYYAPLLLTSYAHPVTRNLIEVKGDFASSVSVVGENEQLSATLLLATSDNTHIIRTPAPIDLNEIIQPNDAEYFNTGYVPVAIALEGVFPSVFSNRMPPREIYNPSPVRKQSKETRQIIIADGDIIRNDIAGSEIVPLGYDRYADMQFGNKEFIQNAVLYLADDAGWIDLRSRTIRLSLLNKKLINNDRVFWQIVNIGMPIVILLLTGLIYQFVRRRKYAK